MNAETSVGQSNSSDPGDSGHRVSAGRWSDRVLGLVCIGFGLWYTFEARTFDGTAFASGPVGPKTMPTGVGILFMTLAAYLVIKPDANPTWPSAKAGWQIGLVVASSYLFGRLIEPIGFIAASIAMTIVMGLLFRAPPKKLLPLAVAFPVVLAFVFNNLLELQLPAGWWGGF